MFYFPVTHSYFSFWNCYFSSSLTALSFKDVNLNFVAAHEFDYSDFPIQKPSISEAPTYQKQHSSATTFPWGCTWMNDSEWYELCFTVLYSVHQSTFYVTQQALLPTASSGLIRKYKDELRGGGNNNTKLTFVNPTISFWKQTWSLRKPIKGAKPSKSLLIHKSIPALTSRGVFFPRLQFWKCSYTGKKVSPEQSFFSLKML